MVIRFVTLTSVFDFQMLETKSCLELTPSNSDSEQVSVGPHAARYNGKVAVKVQSETWARMNSRKSTVLVIPIRVLAHQVEQQLGVHTKPQAYTLSVQCDKPSANIPDII